MEPFDPLGKVAEDHKIEVACSLSHFSSQMKESKNKSLIYFSYWNN